MIDTVVLTEAEVLRRKALAGCRRALNQAPETIYHARRAVLSRSAGEAGAHVPAARTPLHSGWTDTADSAYAQIVDWVTYWAITLGVPHPAADSPWSRGEEVLGFRARTSGSEAEALMRAQTRWLLDHMDQIESLESGTGFFKDACAIVWGLQGSLRIRLQMDRAKPPASPRPCPVCGELEVRAEFYGESLSAAELRGDRWREAPGEIPGTTDRWDEFLEHLLDIRVRCSACGHVVPATETEKLLWLR